MNCTPYSSSDSVTTLCHRASVLAKRVLGNSHTGWFAIAFPAVVRAGICNLAGVMEIALLLFAKETLGYLTSTNWWRQTGRQVERPSEGPEHTLMNHPTCETPGWQFVGHPDDILQSGRVLMHNVCESEEVSNKLFHNWLRYPGTHLPQAFSV